MSQVKYCFTDTVTDAKRLWVNYGPNHVDDTKLKMGNRFYALDSVSCWGGMDKTDTCRDGSTTVSWEISANAVETVKKMLVHFKGDRWVENEFWRADEKRPVA